MKTTKQERVAAFSAALEEIYQNIQNGKKTNFKELGRKYQLGIYYTFLKKALRAKHLINEDCTHWNLNYTIPNEKLAKQIYIECKAINAELQRTYQALKKENLNKIPVCEEVKQPKVQEPKYSLEETVELVKYYGLFKVLWKCLFC